MSTLRAPERAPLRAPGRDLAPDRGADGGARHLRVVRPEERTRRRLTPRAGVVLTAMLFLGLLALAVFQTVLVQGQLRLDELAEQIDVEQARYQELRLRVAELEAPSRIVATAKGELGMVAPADLVYLSPEEALTHPSEAAGPQTAGPEEAGDDGWAMIKPLLEIAPG